MIEHFFTASHHEEINKHLALLIKTQEQGRPLTADILYDHYETIMQSLDAYTSSQASYSHTNILIARDFARLVLTYSQECLTTRGVANAWPLINGSATGFLDYAMMLCHPKKGAQAIDLLRNCLHAAGIILGFIIVKPSNTKTYAVTNF